MVTPDYTKRAVDNYRSKFDLLQLRLPKGWKERITQLTGRKPHDYIIELITADLAKREAEQGKVSPASEKPQEEPKKREIPYFRIFPKDYSQEEIDAMTEEEKQRLRTITRNRLQVKEMIESYDAKVAAEKARQEKKE